jgi:hypothetical protein
MMTLGTHAQAARRFCRDYTAGRLEVTLVAPEIVRVRFVPAGARPAFPHVPIVTPRPAPRADFRVRVAGDYTELSTSSLRLRVRHSRPAVDVLDAKGAPLTLDAGGITRDDGQLRDTRAIRADEEFFGLGLHYQSVAQRGKAKYLKVCADPSDDAGKSHAVVPFLLSTAGYGIFLDSHAYTTFDMGRWRCRRSGAWDSGTG